MCTIPSRIDGYRRAAHLMIAEFHNESPKPTSDNRIHIQKPDVCHQPIDVGCSYELTEVSNNLMKSRLNEPMR